MSYTKGPWKIVQGSESGHCCFEFSIVAQGAEHKVNIAEVIGTYSTDPNEANAQLISAAPDLLEALQELVECGEEDWGEDRPCIKAAKAAINKALGKE